MQKMILVYISILAKQPIRTKTIYKTHKEFV